MSLNPINLKTTLDKNIEKSLNVFKEEDNDIISSGAGAYSTIDALNKFENIVSLMPEQQFIDTVDKLAYTLSNITINDEKVFNDIEDAKKVLQKMRDKKNRRIRKYKLPKKFYRLTKNKEQLTLSPSELAPKVLSPMITKNIKPSTIAQYIYQF